MFSGSGNNAKVDVDLEAHKIAKDLAKKRGISVKFLVSSLIKKAAKKDREVELERKHLKEMDDAKAEIDPYLMPPFWVTRSLSQK